ncbi:MAG: ROK family protein [Planctomycetota bacterium]|jgi:allose kinase|nr:ROK family protein [Planctomycetota bacterium]
MDECVLAIDFSHEKIEAAFVSGEGWVNAQADLPLASLAAGEARPAGKLVSLLANKAKAAPLALKSAIVSLACGLGPDGTRAVNHPAAAWLDDYPLAEELRAALGVPVRLIRRSHALLFYDLETLEIPPDSLVIGCYIDLHFDNAIWYRDGPLSGRNRASGNIAHLTLHGREDACFCGRRGCVDLYGAGVRLRQIHTMIFPETPLGEIFVRLGDHPILREYLAMMAYPVAVEADILAPDFIVIGGGIPAMPGFPRDRLREEIVRQSPALEARILPSASDAASGVACAGRYAFKRGF